MRGNVLKNTNAQRKGMLTAQHSVLLTNKKEQETRTLERALKGPLTSRLFTPALRLHQKLNASCYDDQSNVIYERPGVYIIKTNRRVRNGTTKG